MPPRGPDAPRPPVGTLPETGPHFIRRLIGAARMRALRRRLLGRAIRAGTRLTPVVDRTARRPPGAVTLFCCLRNERARLPAFLDHYRKLGVGQFLMIDNGSDDGSAAWLAAQPDVSLWTTPDSYRAARFGLDWVNALLLRHGRGRWCLTVDVDELLIYPHWTTRDLTALTAHLDRRGIPAMGALMLDLYPQGRIGAAPEAGGAAPGPELAAVTAAGVCAGLAGFDPGPYRTRIQTPALNRHTQGGARERVLFADAPARSPTLNKLPLVRWHWRWVYLNSTHALLPPRLNAAWDGPGDPRLSGVLLHTKFGADVVDRAAEERARGQHFGQPDQRGAYYDALAARPDLWSAETCRLTGWGDLVARGLMGAGDWG